MTGRVESAVRGSVSPGELLATPTARGGFKIARYTAEGLVLLLGTKEAWTPLPWRAMEGVPDFLRGRDWVAIGSVYSTDSQPGSLDEYMKSFLKLATAGWVAVVLERAGVLAIDRSRPCSRQAVSRLVTQRSSTRGRSSLLLSHRTCTVRSRLGCATGTGQV